ncbi:hypothetical protein DSO57_1037251 [Entomophthora muscae]|uniref:Uncharacterized protein n=1 Tax=Entomophthora muscae TaxID=34485 RepID=A0ACC2U834_9FUNG|nr:hypothetical protein DSO57_1037251 [Entomophthora muscae]
MYDNMEDFLVDCLILAACYTPISGLCYLLDTCSWIELLIMHWSSFDHYKQRTWACCILVMATIWRELDTGLTIGSRQRRGDAPADMVEEDKEYVPHQTQPVSTNKHVTRSSSQHYACCDKRISVEVLSRHIPQTVTKDISNHNLTSKEEVDESKNSNDTEEGSPLENLDQ